MYLRTSYVRTLVPYILKRRCEELIEPEGMAKHAGKCALGEAWHHAELARNSYVTGAIQSKK